MPMKNENVIFLKHFLNMDISLPIPLKPFKFSAFIHMIWMQGSLSQNFDLGSSFYFMHSRKKNLKNEQKLPVF